LAIQQVARRCRNEVYDRLSDDSAGFNATLATVAAAIPVEYFAIDFASPASDSFFFGAYNIDDIFESGTAQPNVMCLYSHEERQTGTQKFHTFSGEVSVVIEVSLSWRRNDPLRNTIEDLTDAVAETLIDICNRPANQNWSTELGVTYNGGINVVRGAIGFGAENWQRTMTAYLSFEMHTPD
jgi:hypothetical protein